MPWLSRTSAGQRPEQSSVSPRRRLGGIWLLPSLLLIVLLGLTCALCRAEAAKDHAQPGRSASWVLWGGLTLSLIMSSAVLQALLHRVRAHEQAQRHLTALESLCAISTAISARLGSGGKVLEQLAEAASQLLGMSRVSICMVDESRGALEIVAVAGEFPPNLPRSLGLDQLPIGTFCLQNNSIIIDGDVRREDRPYNVETMRAFGVVSLFMIPLQVEGRAIGLLALSESRPRNFTDLDRRIAAMLGSQASVILSNSQLYERMRSALESQTRLLKQRQALTAANAAIQSTGTIAESLKQITELLPAAFGADLCGLTLLTGVGRESVLVAATPPFDSLVGLSTGPSPLANEAFAGGKPLIVTDARNDPRLHGSWGKIPGVGSILYAPLMGGDRQPMGIMALARYVTGTFSQEQIELAQTFSTLSAMAVENARLLEQTQHDADAKTILLRELNHRVKNNLAGIVALLGMDLPPMAAEVRQWLNRATDRIRAMSGAHQLFTGENPCVSLDALVAQTLTSLAVATPAGVIVRVDLDGVKIALGTRQAVGLAMALHELCYNSLVHGLRGGGTLTIRAREVSAAPATETLAAETTSGPGIIIEVIDNGVGYRNLTDAGARDAFSGSTSSGSGHGLGLVDGLVRRELRGKFDLRRRSEGGSIATVAFSLIAGDENGRVLA
jgi:GAF domain-containing protein/anti-sigma regulatory factor (Ser/Thr protein kinase)